MTEKSGHLAEDLATTSAVLVVEDHASYRELVCRALETYCPGVRVQQADSVASAMAALKAGIMQVMVVDMTLPDGTALDLLGKARQHVENGMKCILFTNYSAADLAPLRQALNVPIYATLTKDQGLRELARLVTEAGAKD